jgi:hypothetical protein
MLSEKKCKTVGGHHNNRQISGVGRLQPQCTRWVAATLNKNVHKERQQTQNE